MVEVYFETDEVIVSKTDLKGKLTYVNDVFCSVSGFTEVELLGKQHNIIRHPDMPRCVFKLLWETIASGQEIFAFVVNRCKDPDDYYWVLAHVTPSLDAHGNVVGFHSNRRVPEKSIVNQFIKPLYRELQSIEKANSSPKQGLAEAEAALQTKLNQAGKTYQEFVFSLLNS